MNKLLVILLVTMGLAACSTSQVKPAVRDTTATTESKQPSITTQAETKAAPASVVEGDPLLDANNILSKRSIYFDFDKYQVKPEYTAIVEAHAKYLNNHLNRIITIEGNADERGSREYNLALGQKRAAAVKKAMNLYGVKDNQIETISFGKEKPRNDGHDEAAWAENRRADIRYQGENN